jgi:hypothetical protein
MWADIYPIIFVATGCPPRGRVAAHRDMRAPKTIVIAAVGLAVAWGNPAWACDEDDDDEEEEEEQEADEDDEDDEQEMPGFDEDAWERQFEGSHGDLRALARAPLEQVEREIEASVEAMENDDGDDDEDEADDFQPPEPPDRRRLRGPRRRNRSFDGFDMFDNMPFDLNIDLDLDIDIEL